MSAVVVGYIPTPEGRAALARGITEAKLRDARLVVVNTTRGDARSTSATCKAMP